MTPSAGASIDGGRRKTCGRLASEDRYDVRMLIRCCFAYCFTPKHRAYFRRPLGSRVFGVSFTNTVGGTETKEHVHVLCEYLPRK